MNELELQIIEVGKKAIDAYEKGNYADFCRLSEKQHQLKQQLELEKIKAMSFKELIEGVNW